ncbi:MAG: hypothetical protein HXX16_14890 [Bacteroidales bacterium]|nr:hypothetical protein [Bacteroidales bacterium]
MLNIIKKSFKIDAIYCLIILLFLFRASIPSLKFPFIIFFPSILIYLIIKHRGIILSVIKKFVKNYILIIVIIAILAYNFLVSDKLYLFIFKDIVNSFILIFIFLLLSLIVTQKKQLNYFIYNFIDLVISFAVIISIVLLCNLFDIFSNHPAFETIDISSNSFISQPNIDYNFALLPIFYGIVCILYFFTDEYLTKIKKGIYNFILILFTICIFFSGSKRGIVLLLGTVVIIMLIQFFSFFIKYKYIITLRRNTIFYLASILILFSFLYIFTVNISFSNKNRTLEFIGSKNVLSTKYKIASNIYRYFPFFYNNKTFDEFFKLIWSASLNPYDNNESFEPKDPNSIWGTRPHKIVFPLKGENVEIIPSGTKGYLMDSTCNADTWDGNAYSFTLIGNCLINKMDTLKASVYCFVSKDFNGTWAMLYSTDSIFTQCHYDLNNKGKWQKLNLNIKSYKNEVLIYLYFSKFGVTDFKSLRGHVIFAYPKIEIIRKDKRIAFFKNNSIIDNTFILLNRNESICLNSALFSFPLLLNDFGCLIIKDKDPIRNWTAQFVSEDTTYHGCKTCMAVDSVNNGFGVDRIARWKFAWQIFTKEYNWSQKIFGGGFNFLNWYGNYFLKDKTKSDYPHNPFLYILLYSGLIGLVLYLFLLYKVFYYYIKYIKEHYVFFIFFLITYFFTFFSGGNPFDPPIMGFFMMLPFFIHHIHKIDQNKEPEVNYND